MNIRKREAVRDTERTRKRVRDREIHKQTWREQPYVSRMSHYFYDALKFHCLDTKIYFFLRLTLSVV